MRGYVAPGFFLSRIVNPIVTWFGISPTLTVRGRHTGRPRTVPFGGPFELEGVRYLVSGRGETDWARNLRVAGQGHLRTGRRREQFKAIELTGSDRERVVNAYRQRFGTSVRSYFERLPEAAKHPVFRIEPVG